MITPEQRQSFYRAAILGLRALEAREGRGRRFGAEADARWARFQGQLHAGDRVQMLLRDASVPWGVGFSGARVFGVEGVAADEPFGATWPVPSAARGQALLQGDSGDPSPTLATCAAALGITPQAIELPELTAGTTLTIAGGAALLAAAEVFATRSDLDWARQVRVVADAPGVRQLAGLASLFVAAAHPCAVLRSTDPLPEAESAAAAVLTSADAEPACAARIHGAP